MAANYTSDEVAIVLGNAHSYTSRLAKRIMDREAYTGSSSLEGLYFTLMDVTNAVELRAAFDLGDTNFQSVISWLDSQVNDGGEEAVDPSSYFIYGRGSPLNLGVSFLGLIDTPKSYVGQAGMLIGVNTNESGLTYIDPSSVGRTYIFLQGSLAGLGTGGDNPNPFYPNADNFLTPGVRDHGIQLGGSGIEDTTFDLAGFNWIFKDSTNSKVPAYDQSYAALFDANDRAIPDVGWVKGIVVGGGGISALTGDVTASGTGSVVATLATVNANVGSFTNANITVNAKGLITAASNGSEGGVTSFNTRTGAVTLSSGDVTGALGFTPENNANKATSFGTLNNTLYPTTLAVSNYLSSNYQPLLGFTAENVANKATSFVTLNNTLYPTTQAVATYVSAAIAPLTGATVFKGTWNANTNTPTLTSGSGTTGWTYTVSVAGTTTLDGISQWNVGDKAVFNGTVWEKIDGIANELLSFSAGTTGLTPNTPSTGNIVLGGTLNVANGGTGQTSFTSGYLIYGNGTGGLSSSSNMYWDGTTLELLNAPTTANQVARLSDLSLADTVLTGMVTTTSGTTATTTAGTYRINNITYTLGSSTNTTIPAQDATLSRWTVLYINTSGVITAVNGSLSADPIAPSIPANTLDIADILITPTSVTVSGSGSKGITSIALSMPSSTFTVTGSPLKANGTITVTLNTESANKVFAGPTSGSAAVPTWRSLVVADLPTGIPNANLANSTISGTSLGSNLPSLTFGTHLTSGGSSYNGTGAVTISTDATATPTANVLSLWDSNINFSANNFIEAYATTATAAGTTTLTVGSKYQQYFTGSTTQTVVLPVATTLVNGQSWLIVNTSSGVVTVQTSGSNVIQAMAANTQLTVTCINTSGGTGTASWNWTYLPTTASILASQSAYTILGNNTGSSAVPTYFTPTLASALFQNQGTVHTVLHGNASGNPSWAAVDLTADVTGILPIANGGTNVNSVTTSPTATAFVGWDANKNISAYNFLEGYTSTSTAAGTTTLTVGSTYLQYFTGTTTQTVTMPVASTLTQGQSWLITNLSTGVVTVQSSGSNTIQVMAANTALLITCISTSGTGTASWNTTYYPINASSGVTAGSYTNTNLTVDSFGRITSASNGLGGSGSPPYGVASGTNTYTVTAGTASSYTAGDVYDIKFTNSNTSTAVTININGIGAANVYRTGSLENIQPGDIIAGQILRLTYDGSNFLSLTVPGNSIIRTNSGTAQSAAFNLSGTASSIQNLSVSSTLSITNGAYIQMSATGGGTWFLDNESENSTYGATFSKSGQPAFKFTDGGVFQRHNGSTINYGGWNISGNKTAQTTTQTVLSYVTLKSGLYNISAAADVTSVSGGTVTITATYTDINSNSQTITYTALSTVTASQYNPVTVWAKTNTTMSVTATVSGTITYDATATITEQ